MNRLVVATGSWQIILAASAIRQETAALSIFPKDYLLLWLPGPSNEMKQTMTHIASLVWDWQSIIWVDTLPYIDWSRFSHINLSQFVGALRNQIPIAQFDEVWITKLVDKAQKLVVESYPLASLVVYEDGLSSYVPSEYWRFLTSKPASKPKKLMRKLRHSFFENFDCLNRECLCPNHINRIEKAYLFLAKSLPVPGYLSNCVKPINKESVLTTINIIYEAHIKNVYKIAKAKNPVLVLGQCFSKWNLITWEEELAIYGKVFSLLADYNLTPIWKEHPRMERPFFKSLVEIKQSIQPVELNVHFSWPVELFANQLNLSGCVSIMSTSLFYLKDLFNIPTYTVVKELDLGITWGECLYLLPLVANHIPPLANITEVLNVKK